MTTTNEDVGLLACPFCSSMNCSLSMRVGAWKFAYCPDCLTEGPAMDNDSDAIAAWNRRAPSKVQVEAVRATEARYVVIGYGESDFPQAAFANEREALLDAVLGMIYTRPSDADDEVREAYRIDLEDEDEWCGNVWRTEFEIGGIVIYDLGYGATASGGEKV